MRRLLPALLLGATALQTSGPLRASEPLEPAAALADFRLPAGYRIELAASEPQVVDPVAIAFDGDGRLWVVEMRDYPTLAEGASPSSRIRILEDCDGDGRFESARTFVDGLLFPTGLQLWGSGAFVTLAGEIAYFPDANQDSQADAKETWYEGFATQNEQLRANHPVLAPDGWIYVAGGLRGGLIKNHRRPGDAPLSINGRDFAFNPRTGECRVASGNSQFGLTFDQFGRRFTCSNRNPLMEVMIEQRYLQRNPKLVPPHVVHDVAAAGDDSRLYPRSRALTTSAQHAGQFTAACGVEIYDGDGLPADARGQAFVCEPTANLVHRESIGLVGAALRSRRVDQEDEILTATDEWFRPVNLHTGPDGALYIVDMYRAVIEHPEWMTEELRNRPDLRRGDDRGRIYRILAEGRRSNTPNRAMPANGDATSMVAMLEHHNAWQQNFAARWILESTAPPVAALCTLGAESKTPRTRYLAASLLDARSSLPAQLLLQAMDDPTAAVRERAMCIAERYFDDPAVVAKALEGTRDSHQRVRFQAALSTMFLPVQHTTTALAEMARRDYADEWNCRAIALAARDQSAELLKSLICANDTQTDRVSALSPTLLGELAAAVAATGGADHVAQVLEELPQTDARVARQVLSAAAQALEARGSGLADAMAAVQRRSPQAHAGIVDLFNDALNVALNAKASESDRIAAAQFLRLDARPETTLPLVGQLRADHSPPLKLAILDALSVHTDERLAPPLLELLPGQLPSVRRATIDLLTAHPAWATELLDAAGVDASMADEISPTHRLKLLQYADPAVQRQAQGVFVRASSNRQEILDRYKDALTLRGDAERGRRIFVSHCTTCHRLEGEGTAVGPDIGDSSMKSSAQLLTDILDPNRAIDAHYINYTALTIDGLAHQGLIQSETDGGVVLIGANGASVTVLREELESLTSGTSLMPEGLEQLIAPAEMADLLFYLKTWRHLDDLRSVPAEQVRQADSGQ